MPFCNHRVHIMDFWIVDDVITALLVFESHFRILHILSLAVQVLHGEPRTTTSRRRFQLSEK